MTTATIFNIHKQVLLHLIFFIFSKLFHFNLFDFNKNWRFYSRLSTDVYQASASHRFFDFNADCLTSTPSESIPKRLSYQSVNSIKKKLSYQSANSINMVSKASPLYPCSSLHSIIIVSKVSLSYQSANYYSINIVSKTISHLYP